jgi:hypothetical protein
MASGYTVRVYPAGGKFEDWHVALPDAHVAMAAGLDAVGLPPNTTARILNELTAEDVDRLKLAPGHARKAG